jgi:hypothetical protein
MQGGDPVTDEIEDGNGREEKDVASTPPDSNVDSNIDSERRIVAGGGAEGGSQVGGEDSRVASAEKQHPSRRLDLRARGYGIAAGYEKPRRREDPTGTDKRQESYGPIPHSGYYGAGEAKTPFKVGQAGFKEELEWYRSQYGRETSGYRKKEKSR